MAKAKRVERKHLVTKLAKIRERLLRYPSINRDIKYDYPVGFFKRNESTQSQKTRSKFFTQSKSKQNYILLSWLLDNITNNQNSRLYSNSKYKSNRHVQCLRKLMFQLIETINGDNNNRYIIKNSDKRICGKYNRIHNRINTYRVYRIHYLSKLLYTALRSRNNMLKTKFLYVIKCHAGQDLLFIFIRTFRKKYYAKLRNILLQK